MRKVVAYLFYSLDGVTESPDRWVFEFDPEMAANLQALLDGQDAVLLGRKSYLEWSEYWPTATDEPFATFINTTPKHVASSTLTEATWANSTIITGSVADEIARLKAAPGRNIGVHASPTLVSSLLHDNLIDELWLTVPPTVAGSGRRLFSDDTAVRRMELITANPTSTGGLLLSYRPGRAS